MYRERIGSPPNAIAANVSIIRLIHKIWTIENGSDAPWILNNPRIGARIFISNVLILTVSWKIRNLPTDLAIVLELRTQSLIDVSELFKITTSPASWETAVPSPMANPISACFKAGASFTPSPVIPHTSSKLCAIDTRRFLSSGFARLTTRKSGNFVFNSSSDIDSNSSWVSTTSLFSSLRIPASFAIATAVSSASPVTITTWIPALFNVLTVSTASCLTLSRKHKIAKRIVCPFTILQTDNIFIVRLAWLCICSSTADLSVAVNSLTVPSGSI